MRNTFGLVKRLWPSVGKAFGNITLNGSVIMAFNRAVLMHVYGIASRG